MAAPASLTASPETSLSEYRPYDPNERNNGCSPSPSVQDQLDNIREPQEYNLIRVDRHQIGPTNLPEPPTSLRLIVDLYAIGDALPANQQNIVG